MVVANQRRHAPDGSVDRVIERPVRKVTSVMFVGPNLDTLFATAVAKPPLPRFPQDGVLRGSLSKSTISAFDESLKHGSEPEGTLINSIPAPALAISAPPTQVGSGRNQQAEPTAGAVAGN